MRFLGMLPALILAAFPVSCNSTSGAHRVSDIKPQETRWLFPFEDANYKTGYMDAEGKVVIEPRFDDGRAFSDGTATVFIDGKAGMIDITGKLIVETIYDEIYSMREGMARVFGPEKGGFIDKAGRLAVPLRYDRVRDFSHRVRCHDVVTDRDVEHPM